MGAAVTQFFTQWNSTQVAGKSDGLWVLSPGSSGTHNIHLSACLKRKARQSTQSTATRLLVPDEPRIPHEPVKRESERERVPRSKYHESVFKGTSLLVRSVDVVI